MSPSAPRRRARPALHLLLAPLLGTVAVAGCAAPPAAGDPPASAAATAAVATTPTAQADVEVVATGLVTARGLTWDPATRRVLVAEAGSGGEAPCATGVGGYPACFGATGAISAYSPADGSMVRIAEGLPSVANEFSVLGLHDLAVQDGLLHVVFGMGGDAATRDGLGAPAAGLASTGVVGPDGTLTPTGDLIGFEQANNPHPADVNANAYGLAVAPEGVYVAEAGGNTILLVTPDGEVRLEQLLPDQTVDGKTFESVPVALSRDVDGAYWIGEYSGEPTTVGTARVWRWVPGSAPEVVHEGFTGIIDVAHDRQGRLLVLELAEQGIDSGNATGRLLRFEPDGTRTVLATDGLEHPGGVTVADDGTLYLTTHTTAIGGDAGQLVRLTPAG